MTVNKPVSILVVDDNPSNSFSLKDILELKGYKVHTSASGAEALEILHGTQIDILLTDVKMAEMNGLELYRATRLTHPKLITIMMTAYSVDELIDQSMQEGIKTVLNKPVDIDFLLVLLSSLKKMISENDRKNRGSEHN